MRAMLPSATDIAISIAPVRYRRAWTCAAAKVGTSTAEQLKVAVWRLKLHYITCYESSMRILQHSLHKNSTSSSLYIITE